jgi:hypothetical protein
VPGPCGTLQTKVRKRPLKVSGEQAYVSEHVPAGLQARPLCYRWVGKQGRGFEARPAFGHLFGTGGASGATGCLNDSERG